MPNEETKEENFEYNIDSNKQEDCEIKDNGVLLISEIQNKILLPYTGEEVKLELEKNNYSSAEEVINDKFTRNFSDYKDMHFARMRESIKLLTERDNFSKLDGINLGMELFGKRYLHPAVISACKNLDELNVYLDCLDKNELDDFKIFEIKYELHPILVDENKLIYKLKNLFKKSAKQENFNQIV